MGRMLQNIQSQYRRPQGRPNPYTSLNPLMDHDRQPHVRPQTPIPAGQTTDSEIMPGQIPPGMRPKANWMDLAGISKGDQMTGNYRPTKMEYFENIPEEGPEVKQNEQQGMISEAERIEALKLNYKQALQQQNQQRQRFSQFHQGAHGGRGGGMWGRGRPRRKNCSNGRSASKAKKRSRREEKRPRNTTRNTIST